MTEIFESKFHKWYVGGEGIIVEKPLVPEVKSGIQAVSMEQVLREYRKYVGDPEAELPEAILKTFLTAKRTENDRN